MARFCSAFVYINALFAIKCKSLKARARCFVINALANSFPAVNLVTRIGTPIVLLVAKSVRRTIIVCNAFYFETTDITICWITQMPFRTRANPIVIEYVANGVGTAYVIIQTRICALSGYT